jgi:hypothetical protein
LTTNNLYDTINIVKRKGEHLKTTIYTEIEFPKNEIFTNEYEIPSKFSFLNDTESIYINEQLASIIEDIYADILSAYPSCVYNKIKHVAFTFVDEKTNFFICTLIFKKFNRITKTIKHEMYDWKGNGIKLKFEETEEKES